MHWLDTNLSKFLCTFWQALARVKISLCYKFNIYSILLLSWHIVLKDDGVVVNGRRCVNILNIYWRKCSVYIYIESATSVSAWVRNIYTHIIYGETSSHHAVDICRAHANTACVIICAANGMKTAGVAPLCWLAAPSTELHNAYIHTCKRAVCRAYIKRLAGGYFIVYSHLPRNLCI